MPPQRLPPVGERASEGKSSSSSSSTHNNDNGREDEDDGNDNTPREMWRPFQETRYWILTRTLGLFLLVASTAFMHSFLSAQALFWLVMFTASLSSLIAIVYHRTREDGLLRYLPASTRQTLQETRLLDWLLDTSLADRLKPYAVISMGLNEEERAFLINSMSSQDQNALLAPGLMNALPESIQSILLPRNQMVCAKASCGGGGGGSSSSGEPAARGRGRTEDISEGEYRGEGGGRRNHHHDVEGDSDDEQEEDDATADLTTASETSDDDEGDDLYVDDRSSISRQGRAATAAGGGGPSRGLLRGMVPFGQRVMTRSPRPREGLRPPSSSSRGGEGGSGASVEQRLAAVRGGGPSGSSSRAVGGGEGGGSDAATTTAIAPPTTATSLGNSWPAPEEVADIAAYVLQRRIMRGWSEAIQAGIDEVIHRITRGIRQPFLDRRVIYGGVAVTGAAVIFQMTGGNSSARRVVHTYGSMAALASTLALALYEYRLSAADEEGQGGGVDDRVDSSNGRRRRQQQEAQLDRRVTPLLTAVQVSVFFVLLFLLRTGRLGPILRRLRAALSSTSTIGKGFLALGGGSGPGGSRPL